MSLPPEHISVKRRRQEEPVETLFLQADGHQSKRRFTDFVFQRIKINEANNSTQSNSVTGKPMHQLQRAVTNFRSSGVPIVRATSPGAEHREHLRTPSSQYGDRHASLPISQPSTNCAAPSKVDTQSHVREVPSEVGEDPAISFKRRFHLTRSLGLPASPAHHSGIPKNRALGTEPNIATFVEIRDCEDAEVRPSNLGSRIMPSHHGHKESPTQPQMLPAIGNSSRKRPRMNVAEKRWREQQKHAHSKHSSHTSGPARTGNSIQDHPSQWNYDSEQLARELEQVALDLQVETSKSTTTHIPRDKITGDRAAIVDEDMDFVYDTYVRRTVEPGSTSLHAKHKVPDAAVEAYGILVIAEEDQELWEAYAEDEDAEWDEEDADSNAEDNPTNDYPEEEVESDDEHDYNPYRYRRGASDDEEFDIDETAWSDGS